MEKKNLRLWLLRFCGILGALLETFGTWVFTAVIVMGACFGLSCLCDDFPLKSTDSIFLATSFCIAFLALVYVIVKNTNWAKQIAEKCKDEIDTKSLFLGFSVFVSIVLCVIAVGVYRLYLVIV